MRLRQILLNLLSNACKFTKEGEVALRVRKVVDGRDWIELAVADTGLGLTGCTTALPPKAEVRPRCCYFLFDFATVARMT